MPELSKEEMLKEIVQRMVDKGWKPSEEHLKKSYKEKLGDYIIELSDDSIKIKICTARVLEQVNRYGDERSVPLYDELFNGSLPDLLADEGAMKALVGEGYICGCVGNSDEERNRCLADREKHYNEPCRHLTARRDKKDCHCYIIAHEYKGEPAFIYHAIQALKLILTPDGDAINYLWEEMKR